MFFAEGVGIFPQFAPFKDKDGKLYASKEKLYVQLNGFMIPKSSPLKASKVSKGPFTNDVSREGEGGGYPNSDVVREVA